MQKHFLWRRQLKDDPSRYKFNPSLLFTPRDAGGLGLVALPVAIQAQRVKVAMLWLIGKQVNYSAAWRDWMGIQDTDPSVTPPNVKLPRLDCILILTAWLCAVRAPRGFCPGERVPKRHEVLRQWVGWRYRFQIGIQP